jgi:hypothetical protein
MRPKKSRKTMDPAIPLAERELFAFITAVARLYGEDQANLAAEDWINLLLASALLPGAGTREWRQITLGAALRLAARLPARTIRSKSA